MSKAYTFEEYLLSSAIDPHLLDDFLNPQHPSWAKFDPVTGYQLNHSIQHDGMDGSSTVSTVQANGARLQRPYINKHSRINTYGNSFTQCTQVNDGETWQEYLAAHFDEPINNFGMGGFGVYQAYRQMRQVESSDQSADTIVFYIWGDDHLRSVMRCRYAAIYQWFTEVDKVGAVPFHGNFWSNLEMNMATGQFEERDNLLATPQSLYRMCDPAFMLESLRDDLMVHFHAIIRSGVEVTAADINTFNRLAGHLGVEGISADAGEAMYQQVVRLNMDYGLAATRYVIDRTIEFAAAQNKRVLFALQCPNVSRSLLADSPRYDQSIVDHLAKRGQRVFDMNLIHQEDFKAFKLSQKDYFKRYFIGHYNPAGNHLFAYAIKPFLLDMLDPQPLTYRNKAREKGRIGQVDFAGYLPE